MNKRKKENKTVINNWNFGDIFRYVDLRWLLKWFLLLIVITSVLGLLSPFSSKISENKDVYISCIDTCKIPNIGTGHTLKVMDKEYTSVDSDEIAGMPSCIDSCNKMYLKLRNK